MGRANTRALKNGPCHGMRVSIGHRLPRGTGVAVKLIDGGYALYRYCSCGKAYFFEERVGERDMKKVRLEEMAK